MDTWRAHRCDELLDLPIAVQDEQIEDPYHVMAGWLRESLHAPLAVLNEHGSDPKHADVVAWNSHSAPPWTTDRVRASDRLRTLDRVRTLGCIHPLARTYTAGNRAPLRISDVIDHATWRRNPNYQACIELDAAEQQIGIPVQRLGLLPAAGR